MSEHTNKLNDDECTVLTLVGPVRSINRAEILAECGRYAAIVRPSTAEQQALLYSQSDLCLFAEASEVEDAVVVSKQELQQKEDSIRMLQELNRRLAEEITKLREQLKQCKQTSSADSTGASSTNSSFIVSSLVSILAPIFSLVFADFPSLSLK